MIAKKLGAQNPNTFFKPSSPKRIRRAPMQLQLNLSQFVSSRLSFGLSHAIQGKRVSLRRTHASTALLGLCVSSCSGRASKAQECRNGCSFLHLASTFLTSTNYCRAERTTNMFSTSQTSQQKGQPTLSGPGESLSKPYYTRQMLARPRALLPR